MSAEVSLQLKVPSPYPGLRPFRENEAYLFFGRERHTKQLREQLAKNRFLAIVGTSGSGKSSLVRAGLLASLRSAGDGVAAEQWRIAELRPGRNPLLHLARALARALLDSVWLKVINNMDHTAFRTPRGKVGGLSLWKNAR